MLPAALAIVAAGFVWGHRSGAGRPGAAAPLGITQRADSALTERERAAFIPRWDELKRRAQAEPTDPDWSPSTEATIRRVVAARLAPEVTLGELRCGSRVCRAQLLHPTSPRIPYVKFVDFTLRRESLGSLEIQLDTRDDGVTILYFLRDEAPPRRDEAASAAQRADDRDQSSSR